MNKILVILLSIFIMMPISAKAKYAAIVIDANTGLVLHEENADTKNYPASLTKMMTLYMLFDKLKSGEYTFETKLKVSRNATRVSPTKLGLRRGETITIKEAILALTIKSANDVAVVVAEAIGGSEHKFSKIMTKKARSLGMKNTYFRNASGLPNRGQLSSARDMSILALALMNDFPEYYHFFSIKTFTYKNKTYKNHNKLLFNYDGTNGIKTGYTRASGFNLVASVERQGQHLIAVVFGGKTARWRDRHITNLLNRGFKKINAHDEQKTEKFAEQD